MKKIIVIFIVMFWLVPAIAYGAPFLVCDPQENVEEYVVVLDGVETIVPYTTAIFDGEEAAVLLDLESVADGQHQVTVKARNVWGESNTVPFEFVRELPGDPSVPDLKRP